MYQVQPLEVFSVFESFKKSIWYIGIPLAIVGIIARNIADLTDGYVSGEELVHLLMAFFFLLGWLFLKPETNETNANNEQSLICDRDVNYLCATQARMSDLQEYHLISQVYTLPFPHLCQIYHLLNLKHLENVHNFSLGGLKIVGVDWVEPTETGGAIKFQTILNTSPNVLRMWREPTVEVELILHTPFTVELSIPAYNGKRMIVIFNVLPLSPTEHKLFIDIYSDLKWYKPLLQVILHFAACLTMIEDLPYLQTLAQRNINKVFSRDRVSEHKTMGLFRRFVELYGSQKELTPSLEGEG